MSGTEKMLGTERRKLLVTTLIQSKEPITGRELGDLTNVSRQVIVGDITLLKAKGEPIIATNRGYVYMHPQVELERTEYVIVCNHTSEQTEEELNTFCRARLAAFKVPREYEFRTELPKTAVGKILRRTLIEEEKKKSVNESLVHN